MRIYALFLPQLQPTQAAGGRAAGMRSEQAIEGIVRCVAEQRMHKRFELWGRRLTEVCVEKSQVDVAAADDAHHLRRVLRKSTGFQYIWRSDA